MLWFRAMAWICPCEPASAGSNKSMTGISHGMPEMLCIEAWLPRPGAVILSLPMKHAAAGALARRVGGRAGLVAQLVRAHA